jgi:FMN reductase
VRIIGFPIGFVIAAWHYRAKHKARQLAVALASGWHVTCRFERQTFCSVTGRGGSAMAEVPRLLMVVGAATPPGRLAAAVAAAAEAVRGDHEDINVDVMNLAETPIDACDGRPLEKYGADTREAVGRIAAAAAVLIAAPVYRASFPGVLKNLLDIAPVEALQGKPVGIVAMGGSAHHYLAVDTQLRPVLGWFGALVTPTGVYLTGADFHDGALTSESARKDLVALADTLLTLVRRLDPALHGPRPLAAKFT